MANPIPKWVMFRYAKLWKKYKDKAITYDDIQNTLKSDDKNVIGVFLNELKKAGWIKAQLNEKDSRMRDYTLRNPLEVIGEIPK